MTSEFQTTVFAYLAGELTAVPAGRLKMTEQGNDVVGSLFGYGARYLRRQNAIPVDPQGLPLGGAVPGAEKEASPPNGLTMFGAVRDAMPDLWGRRLIENKLQRPANSLRESEYMQHAGGNRLGALDFRDSPDSPEHSAHVLPTTELERLVDASDRVQRGERVPAELAQLFDVGPTLGGARPKAVVIRDGVQYLAKFPATHDAFNVPLIERATLELARQAGLTVPKTDIVRLHDGRDVMLIERFDRIAVKDGWIRQHVVSALTALALHESESPNASYADIADVMGSIAAHGRVAADRAELFARMVFNILVSNDDDHLRNHAVIYIPEGKGWALSPLYDVLPKPQIGTERFLHLGVGKKGRLATLDNALSEHGRFGLSAPAAMDLIERIAREVREWRTFFDGIGVNEAECDKVASAFRRPSDAGINSAARGARTKR